MSLPCKFLMLKRCCFSVFLLPTFKKRPMGTRYSMSQHAMVRKRLRQDAAGSGFNFTSWMQRPRQHRWWSDQTSYGINSCCERSQCFLAWNQREHDCPKHELTWFLCLTFPYRLQPFHMCPYLLRCNSVLGSPPLKMEFEFTVHNLIWSASMMQALPQVGCPDSLDCQHASRRWK